MSLIDLCAVHALNREHPHIHAYIDEGEDITTLRELFHKQYDDAVEELRVAIRKVLDKQVHAQSMAVVTRPNICLEAILIGNNISTEDGNEERY